jgi:hypothetical protein
MKLMPVQYQCPIHQVDLSEHVKRSVESDPSLVIGSGFLRAKRRAHLVVPFTVVITCPGKPRTGEPHDLEFSGNASL